jgi:hypothetical protein
MPTSCSNPNASGVSRVVEIDTTGGPGGGETPWLFHLADNLAQLHSRTAEQRDERAAPHVGHGASSPPATRGPVSSACHNAAGKSFEQDLN